jgi:nucleotide-binding universal stress UspA family protein
MKVLLGIGGTEDSIDALRKTVRRANEADDELTVAVVDNPASDRAPEDVEQTVREVLEAEGLDAEVRRVEGDPGSRLVEIAEVEGFDQIALGGGEKSPMGKIRLGTMQEFVLLNATTTVSLVR